MNTFDRQPALTTTHADPRTDGTICFATSECSLGSVLAAQSMLGVCTILLGDETRALARDLSMSARGRARRSCDIHFRGVSRHA